MPPLRLPPWIHKTAHQRDIDLQGIIQSGHYVIMPLCHHAVKDSGIGVSVSVDTLFLVPLFVPPAWYWSFTSLVLEC